MADKSVIDIISEYLAHLPGYGIHPSKAVLFGSYARGDADEWSDIDVLIIAPEFDTKYDMELVQQLWGATRTSDIRIEPIPCGQKEWEIEEGRPILDIARQEGVLIEVQPLNI